MVQKNFNLFSLTGMRLFDLARQFNHDVGEFAIREISQILYQNNIHLLSSNQVPYFQTTELADNIYAADPHGADYILRSEAEHNLLNLLDGTYHIVEALDIVENVMYSGYEFVKNPNTPQENRWNFTIGSAPVIYVGGVDGYLPNDHPKIKAAAITGGLKRSTANTP